MIDKNDPRLTDFVLGELSAAEDSEIQAAIENSPELASAVEEIRQTVELLGAAYMAESPLSLSDEQKQELAIAGRESEIAESKAPFNSVTAGGNQGASYSSGMGRRWWPIALAATLLGLLIGGSMYLNHAPLGTGVADRVERASKRSDEQWKQLGEKTKTEGQLDGQVERFDRAVDNQKFSPALGLAKEAQEVAPDSPTTAILNEKSKILENASRLESVRDSRESGFFESKADSRVVGGSDVNAGADLPEPETSIADSEGIANPRQMQFRGGLAGAGGSGFAAPGGGRGGLGEPVDEGGLGGGRAVGLSPGSQAKSGISENAPMERSAESFTFDGSKTAERSTSDGLEILRHNFDGPESEAPVEEARAGLGGSLSRTSQIPANRLAIRDPNAAKDSDKHPFPPDMTLIVPGAAKNPAPNDGASAKPQLAASQPEAPATPAIKPVDASRLAGISADNGARKDSLAEQAVMPETTSGKELDSKKLGQPQVSEWYGYQDLGVSIEDRIVNEVRTRVVPVERTRTEERVRSVTLDDGSVMQEKYQVQVPYIEMLTENYTVEVPQRVLSIEPEKSRELVEELARRVDPNSKRELALGDLFEYRFQVDQERQLEKGETGQTDGKVLKMAEKLLGELKDEDANQDTLDASILLEQLNQSLSRRNEAVLRMRTWKRVKAIPNTSRLMVGDKDELDLTGMQANVQIDGFRARVLIDCFYYNDRGQALEGNFKLRLPDDASLYYFAFGESAYDFNPKGELAKEEFLQNETQFISLGASEIREARKDAWANVKEAKMVPREKAAHAFRETVRRKVDPALVEWSGAGVFNARVFPLAPHKLHRIVIGYDVNLTKSNDGLVYEFDLPEQTGQCRVDLNVQPIDGVEYRIEPDADPFEKQNNGVTYRKYRFEGPQKKGIRLTASKSPEVLLQTSHDQEGEFWGIQIAPDLPVQQVAGNERAIFLVDTSLSSDPEKFNVWLKLLESTLENNRDSLKQFGVVFFNVDGHFWQDHYVDNTKENVAELMANCETMALEGATDLYGAIQKIGQTHWVYGTEKDQAKHLTGGPDLFLLSDGAANWGETNLRLIAGQLNDHQLGSLFAYQTGLTGTAISGLRFLAGQSGGAVFSVATEDEIKTASTAHRKRPWKLESLVAAGASDVMTAGRVQWVYPGQTITIVGRGTVEDKIELNLTQGGQTKSISISPTRVQSELASRLYGQIAVGQLESLGAKVFDVAASYARHFRVTGDTCSLLMLESDADYERFDIKPQEDLFVIKTKAANELVAETLVRSASELADPKSQLLAWLQRLETMPGMEFEIPTAFGLALDKIQIVAVAKPLDCSLTPRTGLSKEYLAAIENEPLDYALIAAEANRRGATSVDDAIKVFSNLIERNPGDLVIARDVAFTAMELGRPAQAYHLLRQIAIARPFDGSIYPALGQCLAQLGQSDMAIVYYEIALGGTFQRQGDDFKQIVSAEYMHLLRQIVSGDLSSSVKEFANARLETLTRNLNFKSAELLITMMWNTDETDVDLHVIEPSGEECSYENKATRSGGWITSDITTGFGPEMYFNPEAPAGKYGIQVKYFGNGQNRTSLRNKVYLMIYRGFGTEHERVTRKTVQLDTVGDKETVATIGVEK